MRRDFNYEAFTPEDVENGLDQDLLNYLLEYNRKSDKAYYDIHITSDSYCVVIEWNRVNFDSEWGTERFEFVDEEHEILKIVRFPDNHIEYLHDEEAEEALNDWLKEHPGWTKNEYGAWYNEEENKRKYEEIFGKDSKKV